ncbi:MAG: 2-oxo acid dehydrogenase subunit E2, partial [Burkholderiales bacterium]
MATEVKVPDIGDFKNIPVIEVMVKVGDTVRAEDPLVTLESDKATMEIPAPVAGVVKEVLLKLGDRVSEGSPVILLETAEATVTSAVAAPAPAVASQAPVAASVPTPEPAAPVPAQAQQSVVVQDHERFIKAHASPAIRHFARELGVDLTKVKGSGPKGRVLRDDVQEFVKSVLQSATGAAPGAAAGIGLGLLPWPQVDFAKYGPIEVQPLSRIKKLSGANLHRNWVMIPHVTNNDDADITELDAFRLQLNQENAKSGTRVTLLAFIIKAVCNALRKFPEFNASLDGDTLVLKRYYHIGFAADTPNGLIVPVIKDA